MGLYLLLIFFFLINNGLQPIVDGGGVFLLFYKFNEIVFDFDKIYSTGKGADVDFLGCCVVWGVV